MLFEMLVTKFSYKILYSYTFLSNPIMIRFAKRFYLENLYEKLIEENFALRTFTGNLSSKTF